jgi:Lipocalin-like domain
MNPRTAFALSTTAFLGCGIAFSGLAAAQTAKDLVGTWALVSNDTVRPDGTRTPTFGANPKGIIVFGGDGRCIYLFSRSDLPKFETNNRTTGRPDENKAVVAGSIATYGTYSVAGKDLKLKVEHSTFPNWANTDQTRAITVTGDEFKWTNAAGSGGGVVELAFKRAPAGH